MTNLARAEAFGDELQKLAVTRAVQEWRRANAAGDQGTADQIAQASGQLGLKPRYLQDISLGGEEAGVDKMMGRVQSPSGEMNESGYVARKLYKPDSSISRAEFTPKLMEQKQQATDVARSLSPEARSQVPAMYGHQTIGSGPLQRTMSYHEFVPGIQDVRGRNMGTEDKPIWSRSQTQRSGDVNSLIQNTLHPMQERGMTLGDTVGQHGINYGNIASTPQGPKILDFLPQMHGQANPTHQSFVKYAPGEQSSQFSAAGGQNLAALRKEVFKPQMQVNAAPEEQQAASRRLLGSAAPLSTAQAAQAEAGTRPQTPQGMRPQTAQPSMAFAHTAPSPNMPMASTSRAIAPAMRPTNVLHPPSLATRNPGLMTRFQGALRGMFR